MSRDVVTAQCGGQTILEGTSAPRRSRTWGRILRSQQLLIGGLVFLAVTVVAILAPYVAPHDPLKQDIVKRLQPPAWQEGGSSANLLGTDPVGRDVLSRIIYGTRVSLIAGLLAVAVAACVGIILGLLSGFLGGWVDTIITGTVYTLMAFPFMLLSLVIVAVLGPSLKNIIIVLGFTGWPIYARILRAQTQQIRELDYIQAAHSIGASTPGILWRHVLPNLASSICVIASLEVPRMIILESFLSFLGLGVQPPTPTWGGMLGEGRDYILTDWWLATFPGLAIFITTLGVNMLGDGLRDVLDPTLEDN